MSDQDSTRSRPEPYVWELSSAESNTVAVLSVILGEADSEEHSGLRLRQGHHLQRGDLPKAAEKGVGRQMPREMS